ncbi:MAG: J domain-containing protein [Acidimicrobiales bacterium]
MPRAETRTHYELLGVAPTSSFDELRAAYRRLARERHPDVAVNKPGLGTMAEVNEAWRVLSDEQLRKRYDELVLSRYAARPVVVDGQQSTAETTGSVHRQPGSRRQAWAAGVQAQMARLARQAGRSATQTLLIRVPRGARAEYEVVVDDLVVKLSRDVESRVRAARAAGAAPLDLGVGATLVGIRTVADSMRRDAPLGIDTEAMMAAELLDRMWDVLAHELPVQLTTSLGGNPHVAQALARHL